MMQMRKTASILWRTTVGSIQSRSSIIIEGDRIYVGTCGNHWNHRDKRDGVHCISLSSGNELWFTPTLADVNEIALAGSDLIAPTDSGDVFVIDGGNGEIKFIGRADGPVLAKPIVYRTLGGWTAVIASLTGTIYRLESHSKELSPIGQIGAQLRANIVPLGFESFVACGENGLVYKAHMASSEQLISHPIAELPISEYGGAPSITAGAAVDGSLAYIGYARDTYYQSPAVACVDLENECLLWTAPKGNIGLGNVRATPLLIDGRLVVASAYSDSLQIMSPVDGELLGQVVLGQNVFQQWSGPTAVGPHHVAVGRVDGVCSIVDIRNMRLMASVSLVTADKERSSVSDHADEQDFKLYPGEPAPAGAICGTPAFSGKSLVIGTTDGALASISIQVANSSSLH